ncbi:hypothetical protein GQX73_g1333 [Xylaria multiplex]|uniref:Major facilitator superfamily (MFS) profile domain-containing protein n=1 Tax=Xylaria multiplex TaxID=323545 RepID=A0A7C8ITX7_9PEZI|nr:hypothetical protein GQX73_g1333 [Xylaria multiplex]
MGPNTSAPNKQHLVHSHAHEEDIPGTVNLNAAEGDDTGYGQALFPVPAEDPNDPLQWSNFKKTMILIICSFYSFLANAALIGPSPYIDLWAKEFDISPTKASELISYPNLAFGFGSLVFVPLYLKIGRRPVMLISLTVFCAGIIGASQCTTYGGLMATRVIHGFGSSVCEALPVQLVNDIFFLHERGERIGYYTGYALAVPFTSSSDKLAAYYTKRNNGIREAEMRLGVMLPASTYSVAVCFPTWQSSSFYTIICASILPEPPQKKRDLLIGPAGIILYGIVAEKGLHWVLYFVGGGLSYFAAYFYFSFTLAYAVDSYHSNTSEMLIAMNLGKQ